MLALYGVTPSGKQRVIAQAPGAIRLQDLARDGRVLVTRDSLQVSTFALAPGAARERDLSWLEWSRARYLSPDGKVLLFEEQSAPVGTNYAVCVRQTDGSPVVRLGEGQAIALSPDGKWALSRLPAAKQPYVLLPTGAGQPRPIAFDGFENYGRPATPELMDAGFVLSPDGRCVAAVAPPGVLVILSLDAGPDGAAQPVSGAEAGDVPVVWSADGRSIFVRRMAGTAILALRIFRVDLQAARSELWKEIAPADPAGVLYR